MKKLVLIGFTVLFLTALLGRLALAYKGQAYVSFVDGETYAAYGYPDLDYSEEGLLGIIWNIDPTLHVPGFFLEGLVKGSPLAKMSWGTETIISPTRHSYLGVGEMEDRAILTIWAESSSGYSCTATYYGFWAEWDVCPIQPGQ